MDILTPKGQESLRYERVALEAYRFAHPDVHIFETRKDTDAKIDGMLVRDDEIVGIFETKCRNATHEQMKKWGTWLITHQKVVDAAVISELMRVPFYGFLYLIPDNTLLVWQVTDERGKYLFQFESENTRTQATINGGTANRKNAFLPVSKVIEVIPCTRQ